MQLRRAISWIWAQILDNPLCQRLLICNPAGSDSLKTTPDGVPEAQASSKILQPTASTCLVQNWPLKAPTKIPWIKSLPQEQQDQLLRKTFWKVESPTAKKLEIIPTGSLLALLSLLENSDNLKAGVIGYFGYGSGAVLKSAPIWLRAVKHLSQ